MIEFKTPSDEDVAKMKDFANSIDNSLSILGKSEMSHVSHFVASKLQEALFWFSHGVLNMPAAQVVPTVDCVIEDADGS